MIEESEVKVNEVKDKFKAKISVQQRYTHQFAAARPTFANLLIQNFFRLPHPTAPFADLSATY